MIFAFQLGCTLRRSKKGRFFSPFQARSLSKTRGAQETRLTPQTVGPRGKDHELSPLGSGTKAFQVKNQLPNL